MYRAAEGIALMGVRARRGLLLPQILARYRQRQRLLVFSSWRHDDRHTLASAIYDLQNDLPRWPAQYRQSNRSISSLERAKTCEARVMAVFVGRVFID